MTQSLIVIIIDLDLKEAEDLYVKCGNGDHCKINIARAFETLEVCPFLANMPEVFTLQLLYIVVTIFRYLLFL